MPRTSSGSLTRFFPQHEFAPFGKIMVPVFDGCDPTLPIRAARLASRDGQVTLLGIVGLPPDEPLSSGTVRARAMRRQLRDLGENEGVASRARVRVTHTPWDEIVGEVRELRPSLLILEWPCALEAMRVGADVVLGSPVCDIALVRGPIPPGVARVLVPLRGGPYAEMALRFALAAAETTGTQITSFHIRPPAPEPGSYRVEPAFKGLSYVLANLPEVAHQEIETLDAAGSIVERSGDFDLVVMGASALPAEAKISLGAVTDRVLRESPVGVVVVKTRQSLPAELGSETMGLAAISVLVDKWFAEQTYHADEFMDMQRLVALKQQRGVTISLALPALDEEETVGHVVETLHRALFIDAPLLDEIVLMDSNSTDRTREIAAELGVRVHVHQAILPRYGARNGKGEALWKSLYTTHGDIIIWIDTDIVNIHPRFVYGLVGPLLLRPGTQFVKGFYRRPLRVGDKMQAGGGGRVTELTARPLLNLFYPELSGIVQPLSGEYGGRRSALEQLSFFSGYGVEIGLLIDIFEKYGLAAIAQVDLQERVHHNQPLEALSKMSFAIIQAVIHKLERRYGQAILEDINKTMKTIRYSGEQFFLDVDEIAEQERPPMLDLPEYRAKLNRTGEE